MKKMIFIGIAIILVLLLYNKIDTTVPVSKNIGQIIGCMDYDYKYDLNVPAKLTFYVTEKNEEDKEGFFKVITTEETTGETILHCGNAYFLTVEAYGYKTYSEKIEARSFRLITPEVHEINLERF